MGRSRCGLAVVSAGALAAFCGSALAVPPGVRVVNHLAAPGGDGLTWETAYDDLQVALAAAQGSTEIEQIWVAQGVYAPAAPGAGPGAQAASFELMIGLEVYGGFAGHETVLSQRNWEANVTILSGAAGPVHVWHVVSAIGTDLSAVLDGFTVTGGAATEFSPHGVRGGGILILDGSANIRNCTIRENMAIPEMAPLQHAWGGGVYGTGVFDNCIFAFNVTTGYGGGLAGGGELRDCSFVGNDGLSGGGGFYGSAAFERCEFVGNGGGSFGAGGGAVFDESALSTFVDCDFLGNAATFDSGAVRGGGTFIRCLFFDNYADSGALGYGPFHLVDCHVELSTGDVFTGFYRATINATGTTFVDNHAFRACVIDAMHCIFTGGSSSLGALIDGSEAVRLVNCTLYGIGMAGGVILLTGAGILEIINSTIINNSSYPHAAIRIFDPAATVKIYNTILWNNFPAEHDQIEAPPGTVDVRSSIVRGWTGLLGGTGNSGWDPLFADGEGRLAAGSPAIDAGDTSLLPPSVTLDLDGNPRLTDDPGTPNSGAGSPPVDIGAFEFQGQTCYANCDQSTTAPILNIDDFTCFINRYAMGHPLANCDGSTTEPILDVNDFACFIEAFMAGCP
jgi:hypothetical protein